MNSLLPILLCLGLLGCQVTNSGNSSAQAGTAPLAIQVLMAPG
jgi:hypothetical protein